MIYYDQNDVIVRDSIMNDVDLWTLDPFNEMRPLEVMEVWASDHWNPTEAVFMSWARSLKSYTIFHKKKLVGMFGVIPDALVGERARVWLLTTHEIERMGIRFLKLSREYIGRLRDGYPVLYNWVDARNEQCLKWLRWCGAEVYPPETFGKDGLPFHYFTLGGR